MFTMKNLNRVLKEIPALDQTNPYSINKSRVSYTLQQISSCRQRGYAVEAMIRDELILMGYKVDHLGFRYSYDLRVDGNRIEVKSALARTKKLVRTGETYETYDFQNIKTDCFDYLVLVFITPNGLISRMLTQEQAKYILRFSTEYTQGKTMSFDTRNKLPGESFDKFWKEDFSQVAA